ncbi:MAG TPA: hypothetical protein VF503_33335 [Sphingobium sp.]|uniref:hypothetical protein n=1 Tax=Sphingobium sp. TaxID=1912891 RepID=UPI002ED43246
MTEKTEAPRDEAATKGADIRDTAAASGTKDSEKGSGDKSGADKGNGKIWMGTAVGVGSAALVAALMYAKRRK